MNEMKKAARSLVEARHERFDSHFDLATSRERVAAALQRAGVVAPWPFSEAWTQAQGRAALELTYPPSAGAQHFLRGMSMGFLLLIAASAWAIVCEESGALRFLLPLFTVLALLGFPFVTLAMASTREARESRIRRAVKAALAEPDEER
jgi:hypothetical protein